MTEWSVSDRLLSGLYEEIYHHGNVCHIQEITITFNGLHADGLIFISPTGSYASLPRSTTSSGRNVLTFQTNHWQYLLIGHIFFHKIDI